MIVFEEAMRFIVLLTLEALLQPAVSALPLPVSLVPYMVILLSNRPSTQRETA